MQLNVFYDTSQASELYLPPFPVPPAVLFKTAGGIPLARAILGNNIHKTTLRVIGAFFLGGGGSPSTTYTTPTSASTTSIYATTTSGTDRQADQHA